MVCRDCSQTCMYTRPCYLPRGCIEWAIALFIACCLTAAVFMSVGLLARITSF